MCHIHDRHATEMTVEYFHSGAGLPICDSLQYAKSDQKLDFGKAIETYNSSTKFIYMALLFREQG